MAKPIPMTSWGKDHWSTLGYIECRCVDHRGIIVRQHLRVNPDLHPGLAHHPWHKDYPTHLKNGANQSNHDDIDCIEDMVAAVLIIWGGTGINPIFSLTDLGMMVCNALRNHKSSGGNFGNFEYQAPDLVETVGTEDHDV